jgi:hypothetical protein
LTRLGHRAACPKGGGFRFKDVGFRVESLRFGV